MIVYTTNIHRQEYLRPPWVQQPGWRYVCFTDRPELIQSPWEARLVSWSAIDHDPARACRWYKTMSHIHFPDESQIIWIDTSITPQTNWSNLLDQWQQYDILAFQHFARDCLYDEADEVALVGLDDPSIILAQMQRYVNEGYPAHNGLCDGSFIIRKHTSTIKQFNQLWWSEICNGSRRDQLSFNYCLWKLNIVCGSPDIGVTRNPFILGTQSANKLFTFSPNKTVNRRHWLD